MIIAVALLVVWFVSLEVRLYRTHRRVDAWTLRPMPGVTTTSTDDRLKAQWAAFDAIYRKDFEFTYKRQKMKDGVDL